MGKKVSRFGIKKLDHDRDNEDDIPVGSQEDRNIAIDLQFDTLVIFLFDEMACSHDEVEEALERLRKWLKPFKKDKKETGLEKANRILAELRKGQKS